MKENLIITLDLIDHCLRLQLSQINSNSFFLLLFDLFIDYIIIFIILYYYIIQLCMDILYKFALRFFANCVHGAHVYFTMACNQDLDQA